MGSGEDHEGCMEGVGEAQGECMEGSGRAHYIRSNSTESEQDQREQVEVDSGRASSDATTTEPVSDFSSQVEESLPHSNYSAAAPISNPSEEANIIHSPQQGARHLARRIYKLSNLSVAEEVVEEGAQDLLPLVQAEPVWDTMRLRVEYALRFSKDFAMTNPRTGDKFTWYEAISGARNPVKSFIKNYDMICKGVVDFKEFLVKQKQEKQKQDLAGGIAQSIWDEQAALFAANSK
jgi:hypothetical protein